MKVLWLTSWYPNEKNPFNGNFIQRHAIAASKYCEIRLIHVESFYTSEATEITCEKNQRPGLTETIALVPFSPKKSSVLINQYKFYLHFKKLIDADIAENGMPDVVHVHIPVRAGLLALYCRKKYKLKYFVTEHAGIYHEGLHSFQSKPFWFRLLSKKVIRHAERLLCVSAYSGEGINSFVVKKHYSIIPNAVDTDLFRFNSYQKESSVFQFIHVSAMNENKNPKLIMQAFANLKKRTKDVKLLMIGNNSKEFFDHRNGLGLTEEDVKIMGAVSYEEVCVHMQQSHAFVLFSSFENSPCVIAEALCCGLPVISSDAGGVKELTTMDNSILIPAHDVHGLSKAMEQMIMLYNRIDCLSIARESEAMFNYERIGACIYEEYKKHLNKLKI